MAAGVGLLSIGSQLIVSGAVAISTGLGVSNLVVGLTVVAIGTSFPELATSLSALRRGDLRVEGLSPRADMWRLAIENPYDRSQRLSVVELRNQGLATSTVTKRRFEVEGRETHHSINPTTLRSAESDTVQASVIAPTAAQAEMWTKVAFVHGSQRLLAFARQHGFHAGCLLQTGEWVTSAGWPGTDA